MAETLMLLQQIIDVIRHARLNTHTPNYVCVHALNNHLQFTKAMRGQYKNNCVKKLKIFLYILI